MSTAIKRVAEPAAEPSCDPFEEAAGAAVGVAVVVAFAAAGALVLRSPWAFERHARNVLALGIDISELPVIDAMAEARHLAAAGPAGPVILEECPEHRLRQLAVDPSGAAHVRVVAPLLEAGGELTRALVWRDLAGFDPEVVLEGTLVVVRQDLLQIGVVADTRSG